MVEDVIFHEFAHEAVYSTTGGGETAEYLRALLVAVQALEYGLELADDLLG